MLPTFSLVQDNLRASMEALELLRQNADYVSSKLEVKTGLKRKLAAVKIAIGKESSDRLITRLNESVTLLSLALQAWTIDEGQLPRKPKDDAKLNKKYTASRFGRFVMAYATTTGAWQAYLQLPSWLSSSVYELQSTPTGYGWTYNYRVYNLVSSKSDIIQKIKQGDRDGILELFGTRKASPFDKDEYGQSLLYHAAKSKNLDICQLLLSLGLREALVEKPGPYGESPLAPPVLVPSRSHPEKTWLKIAGLFQSYMDEPETSMVLLLLAEDRKFTSFDVSESSRTGFSLVHSIAVAFGIRFADEVLPFKRDWIMWYLSPFGDHWSHMVQGVASVATAKDLHTVEKIQPWDVYQVPCWRGTPLISVIGGALCYLSPDISFVHWDNVFQECIQKWASLLQLSGVDLMLYGEQEAANLNKYFRSSFDMSAIEASRNEIRNVMPRGSARMTFRRAERADRERWNKNHWVPIRLLKLKFGQTPGEWQISWAPEFECMANEFWQMVDKGETTMPGSWVDG
ncbi:hypothetical protein FOXYS1_6173 [Fusarium oxysporum]|uniref:Uncharacterized protein n=1 Tax=Fusarium oxysporum TaxID=5507 RepID=A0A8H5AFI3_FUSOX|nr:hypothetical protein FOXYS1_6173 [Fusarium oxysporum]